MPIYSNFILRSTILAVLLLIPLSVSYAQESVLKADLCIYGGTSAGVIAAVAAVKEGRTAIIVEPSRWLGGMTGGGIGTTDFAVRETVGGLSDQYFRHENWTGSQRKHRDGFLALVREHRIKVLYEYRLAQVEKRGKRIVRITVEKAPPDEVGAPVAKAIPGSSINVQALMFIDASYEGDLMARAKVSYTYGRESSAQYKESQAGLFGVEDTAVRELDPYVKPGDPSSGLLPMIQKFRGGTKGDADRLSMAFCFRLKTSTDPAQRWPLDPPPNYDPAQYELVARLIESNQDVRSPFARDGNYERRMLVSTGPVGENADYPDGDYATRARIWKEHEYYLRGLVHFYRTDSRIPEKLRQELRETGLVKGEFDETKGWPHQLYVRTGRRMIGHYVMVQADVEGKTVINDSIGMNAYVIDIFPVQRIFHDGKVIAEGGNKGTAGGRVGAIYRIPYRAITPKPEECENLLVPVCLSASHVAMGSLRMEPVYMILAESAALAACQAINEKTSVQKINVAKLRHKLRSGGQVLEYEPVPKKN